MSAARALAGALVAGFAPARAKGDVAVDTSSGWFGVIRESFGGAFQRGIAIDAPKNVVAFGAVFSCVTLIASDIAKLCLDLLVDQDGILADAPATSPYWAVLKKPNRYQNRIKFIEQWVISKLIHGNTYVLKERKDLRGIVTGLYVLNPQRVQPLVTDDGDVYYRCSSDPLSGLKDSITVPASEIIHDMMVSLWHPLVGISPIFACGLSATMGNRITANSTAFFGNMSQPSGQLTSPQTIDDVTANRLKSEFEQKFSRGGIGRLFVSGDGLKYEAMTTIPAEQAQLIEQLNWTIEDVARCFHVPLYKLGVGSSQQAAPSKLSLEALNQGYYNDCLQKPIEDIELCLKEGLGVPDNYAVKFDLDGLLRMDAAALVTAEAEAVKGSIKAPNESRRRMNLPPVKGGESPLSQQQNYSLAALAKRDALPNPFVIDRPTTNPTPSPEGPAAVADPNGGAKAATEYLTTLLELELAP